MTGGYTLARRVAFISLVVSALLAAMKIGIGIQARSTATVADGIESAADVLASGLLLLGLTIAMRPADWNHPYGHGRFEILAGLGIGLMLALTGVAIAFQSFAHIGTNSRPPALFALWPLLLSVGAKSVLSYTKLRLARRIRSAALEADGKNDAVDLISGLTAIAALGLTLYDPRRFAEADNIGGIAVGGIVVFLGMQVIRDTAAQLMDTAPEVGRLNEIRGVALRVPGALAVEKVLARKTGLRWHVDMHLHVEPMLTVQASHAIAGQVKSALREELDWIDDVLIHVEPFEEAAAKE